MICFRCRRGYKSKKEFGAFYQIKMKNGKGHVDGYWLCPECAKALREWLYGETTSSGADAPPSP